MKRILEIIDRLRMWWSFSSKDLAAITAAVTEAEKHTSGEIRVVIRVRRETGVNDVKAQAERDFLKHGLQNTEDQTGVLLLIVLQDHQFWLMGDKGVNDHLDADFWSRQSLFLSSAFAGGSWTEGICQVVLEIGHRLAEHFPRQTDDADELPNTPVVV